MANYIHGSESAALDVLRAFGVQPEGVRKIVFTLEADRVATLDIYRYAPGSQILAQIGEQLGGSIQQVEHEIT